jgi:hypothetical protein
VAVSVTSASVSPDAHAILLDVMRVAFLHAERDNEKSIRRKFVDPDLSQHPARVSDWTLRHGGSGGQKSLDIGGFSSKLSGSQVPRHAPRRYHPFLRGVRE